MDRKENFVDLPLAFPSRLRMGGLLYRFRRNRNPMPGRYTPQWAIRQAICIRGSGTEDGAFAPWQRLFANVEMDLFPAQSDIPCGAVYHELEDAPIKLLARATQQLHKRLRRLMRLKHARLPASEDIWIVGILLGHAGADE